MYKKIVLENGLMIITADMPGMESLSVGVWIGAGGRYENKKHAGISHFLEHMVFKGTKKRSAQELKESIEGRGGALNGFTGEEFTCYLAKVLAKDANTALDVLIDMTLNPRIAPGDFAKERFVILEEIKMYKDMPSHYVHELLAELMWPDQPLGMSLLGTNETISRMRQKDLAAYREDLYNPKNIVISLAGRLPPFDLAGAVTKSFTAAKTRPRPHFSPAVLRQRSPMTNFYFKETEQTHLALGIHGYSRFSKDKYSLDLLNIILGGNMSSRLFQRVREELGLAYEISSSVKHYHDTGTLVISAGIDNKKVAGALKVIISELKKIRSKKVTKEEFQRAKDFYKGQLLMAFEDTMSHMLWLGEKFISGDFEFHAEEILAKIDKTSIDDIQEAAQDILKNSNLNLAVVGPAKKKEESELKKRLSEL